ncbi:uncharacterized protein SCHCODRAFT_02496704 [Schizophyllum commune H4-8]|nr:uncharacterized protein SCHCODRAFT_02496704 [Schizophyllum commune H4-8]KAI5894787.1 hypothetical protein SCHCODRAFT_02496704 [Schizophyllum commune H4-8]
MPWLKSFKTDSVTIEVPSGIASEKPSQYIIPGLVHTNLTSLIKAAFQDDLAHLLHYSPFELHHEVQSKDGTDLHQRVHGEIYTSPAFLEAHDEVRLRSLPPPDNPDCKLERTVAAVMFASDAAHLTNFGTAKVWPIYMMLGNLSKYIRAIPNSDALHHLAYVPSLPPDFNSFAAENHAKWATQHKDITTHCRRELMHAVWKFLLDEEFLQAYKYGVVVRCVDGVERRIYPRIFTYSADYPEKVLLGTIRDGGLCPCPRCLVEKSQLDRLGTPQDTTTRTERVRAYLSRKVQQARSWIYKRGKPIGGTHVDDLLKESSSVPTVNAFVHRLGADHNFEPAKMLVVDLLHEVELGVWKATLTHLIRILWAADPRGGLVDEFNERCVCLGI